MATEFLNKMNKLISEKGGKATSVKYKKDKYRPDHQWAEISGKHPLLFDGKQFVLKADTNSTPGTSPYINLSVGGVGEGGAEMTKRWLSRFYQFFNDIFSEESEYEKKRDKLVDKRMSSAKDMMDLLVKSDILMRNDRYKTVWRKPQSWRNHSSKGYVPGSMDRQPVKR